MKQLLNIIIMLSFLGFGKSNAQTKKEFKDPLNTAVFTTKYVIEENKDITYVTHELEDGSWQFFSDDKFEDFTKVALLVSIENIIKRDKTVLEIADLPLGCYAKRKNRTEKWEIFKTK
ncbi:DUF2185 domain-containing protein [Flavobacterium franklandianum]|uniref:DUF2185 domain-containing protein n=2 Tax=Flavobacterium franklandianum TaxID=2594430 RepID=A0A553C5T2_9FLAO|nr:DUF2185 domain-containing protein [Flavobacterium franklandianum]